MLDLAGETCLIHHKNVPFYRVDEANVHKLEGFSLEEGLSSASTQRPFNIKKTQNQDNLTAG